GFVKQLAQSIDNGLGIIAAARRHFLDVDRAVRAEDDDVGEGAADIDTDANRGSHFVYSVACFRVAGSCHWTLGTSHQPRALPISVRSRSVASASTRHGAVSPTTPQSDLARPADRNSLRTSRSTACGSRSSGSPQPPPPASTWRNTSPLRIVIVSFDGRRR